MSFKTVRDIISVMRMLYGIESTYINESDMNVLEQAHRQHTRIIQNVKNQCDFKSSCNLVCT